MEILTSLISPLSPLLNLKEELNNSSAKSYNVHTTVLNQLISICHKEIQTEPPSTGRSHA